MRKRNHWRVAAVVLLAAGGAVAVADSALADTCTVSTADGSCGPYAYPGISGSAGSNTYVANDVWNVIPGWQQTLTATDPGHWSVTANLPAGNTAVVSYPHTQQIYTRTDNTPDPLSNYSSIYSSFSHVSPGGGSGNGNSYDVGYDIWLGQSYTFTGWLRAASRRATVTVTVTWIDASSFEVGVPLVLTVKDTRSGWTEFTGHATAPAGATHAWEILESDNGGTHYLDDLVVSTP